MFREKNIGFKYTKFGTEASIFCRNLEQVAHFGEIDGKFL